MFYDISTWSMLRVGTTPAAQRRLFIKQNSRVPWSRNKYIEDYENNGLLNSCLVPCTYCRSQSTHVPLCRRG